MAITDDFDPLTVPAVLPQSVKRITDKDTAGQKVPGFPTQALLDYEQALQGWMRNTVVATNTRFTEVSDSLGDVTASVTTETAARVAADEALAASITTVEASVGDISADGAVYIAAKATPTGATAAYGVHLTAGSSFAGLEMLALSAGGSGIGLSANQLKFTDSGTATDVLEYSAGKFRFTGDVAIDGNLAVSGSFTADAVASGFTNRGSTAGTVGLAAGTTGWTDLGSPITLAITADGGNAYPVVWIRDAADAINFGAGAGAATVSIRLLINGTEVYNRQILNVAIPAGQGRADNLTDFFDVVVGSSSLTFQLQYQHNYSASVSGQVFAKVMAFMSSR